VTEPAPKDVIQTAAEDRDGAGSALIVIEPLRRYLADLGFDGNELSAAPIGDGHSNVTYELWLGDAHLVLRRPPRPPYPPSAHNVIREARLLARLKTAGMPVPHVLAICDDVDVIGAPFYVMEFLDGVVISDELPEQMDTPGAREGLGRELTDTLIALHRVDVEAAGLRELGRPGYLERQLRTFGRIWCEQRTREIPEMEQVEAWLGGRLPPETETTVVHGDYRLGNVMFASAPLPTVLAVLDWEMSTLGDPLADLGYLRATWAEPGADENPMNALSAATRLPSFMSIDEVCERYAQRTARDISALGWYEVLALWKAAVFLESSYRRYKEGRTSDPYFAQLSTGVPELAREALRRTCAV
jgi:aminoglycoside phosphotransferase (APT) family kinase protein